MSYASPSRARCEEKEGPSRQTRPRTFGQEPDEGSGSATDDDAPTDRCRMVQEAVRKFGKKKKAADQSKKAGSTRKDAHSGDNHGMMSQDKRGRKGKRSGYTVQ